jgi:hypothetical protein
VFSGEVAYGAEIFEAMRLESLGDMRLESRRAK